MINRRSPHRSKIVFLVLYLVFLFSVIPYIWYIEVYLRAHTMLMRTVHAMVALYLGALYIIMLRYLGLRWKNFLVVTALILAYLLLIMFSHGFDKKMHFIEYGLLTFLLYDVLRGRMARAMRYPVTLLIVTILGSIDEGIQYFVPGRSFDLSDLLSNVYAAFLMLVMIFIVERRKAAVAKSSGD